MLECRIKYYTQEIVIFRQDLLYRMRRSCLMPSSTDETSDPFEHVSLFFYIFYPVNSQNKIFKVYKLIVFFSAACRYHNTSKPSVPPAFECTTHHLELWSLSSLASNSTNSNTSSLLTLKRWDSWICTKLLTFQFLYR